MTTNKPSVWWLFGIVGVALVTVGCAQSRSASGTGAMVTIAPGQPPTQAVLDRKVQADFQRDVNRYMTLHDKLQSQGTPQRQRSDVGENVASSHALAARIRQVRRDAERGDILTEPIALFIRATLNPSLRGDAGGDTRKSIRDDGAATFVLKVNGDYPDGESRSTMPGNLLAILPPLPSGLEYRIVDTHLVLMDVDANLVVDFLRDVMCATC